MRLAIFDVDGTLISGKSTEKRFIAWLLRRGCLGPRQILSMVWFVGRWFPRFGRHVFRKNKAYLDGLNEDLVAEEARKFTMALPEADFIQPALAALRRHKANGDIVVLLSGTLQPIVEVLSRRLGADLGIGAEARILEHRYTAAPPTRHPFYHEKAELLDAVSENYMIAADQISAYADSRFDIPILSMVGEPTAVCPDRGLAEWAMANEHRIVDTA
jgi:HAD superfamily phosphoserine phosphatase-like hydrolase